MVGGCTRDWIIDPDCKPHDIDYVVLAPSFEAMRESLLGQGFKIHVEHPEFLTIRAGVPKEHPLRDLTKDADFVMARSDSPTSDGRRPDYVEPGTLLADLSRRDFSMNAVAKNAITGEVFDPFNGREDIMDRSLVFVGDPMTRIKEDGLRVLRGFRFMITKGFAPKNGTWEAITSEKAAEVLLSVSVERTREELEKMFAFSTLDSLRLISKLPLWTQEAILRRELRLMPTMAERWTRKSS